MKSVQLCGDIIPNDYKWIYDWMEWDATCPKDIRNVIDTLEDGEELEVYINSGGGDVKSGQEMYTLLQTVNATAKIQSFAASAASVAAMGCKTVLMSDVGTFMIHNVSCGCVSGDYHDMEKARNMLQTLNEIMANAYVAKTGMELKDVLELMDRETWLSAKGAIAYGFADGILQKEERQLPKVMVPCQNVAPVQLGNTVAYGLRLTEDVIQKVRKEKQEKELLQSRKSALLKDLDRYGV